jgi:choline kinase
LDMIRQAGISQIAIVTGFGADLVRKVGGDDIIYVHNEDYPSTNSMYSLYLAKQFLDYDILLLNSDIVFEPRILAALLEEECQNAVMVDFNGPVRDGEINVKVSNGYVTEISRFIAARDAVGQTTHFAKFGKESARVLRDEIVRLVEIGYVDGYPSDTYGAIIMRQGIKAVDVGGAAWCEIDTPEDYAKALNLDILRR